jgi:hypothetical protein
VVFSPSLHFSLTTPILPLKVEKDNKNKLLAPPKRSEKTYLIDDHILCAVAGATTQIPVHASCVYKASNIDHLLLLNQA